MSVIDLIRKVFRREKEEVQKARELAQQEVPGRAPIAPGFDVYSYYGLDAIADYLKIDQDLLARYLDYEQMQDYPEIWAALDVYADNVVQPNTLTGKSVWADADDSGVQEILEKLLHRNLRIDEDIWEIVRTTCLYGNDYEEILVTENDGVIGLNHLPPPTVRRYETPQGEIIGFAQDLSGAFRITAQELHKILKEKVAPPQGINAFEDYRVVHFRIRGRYRRSVYGHSLVESARWIWKRLLLLEDAMLIHRLTRAPGRWVFYIDVGDIPPKHVKRYLEQIKNEFKKKKLVNPETGRLDMRMSPLSQDEDFFVAVRGGRDSTRIEPISQPSWGESMEDILYFRQKLYTALKIPKAYLTMEEDVSSKAILAHENVVFAATVLRIQREIRNGLKHVARVHLASRNIDPDSTDFEIWMTVPSSIYELAQMEIRNARLDLAEKLGMYVSRRWIMRELLGFTDEEIDKLTKEKAIEERGEFEVRPEPERPRRKPRRGGRESLDLPADQRVLLDEFMGRVEEGNREHEKKLEDGIEKLLQEHSDLRKRLYEVRTLCSEIRQTVFRHKGGRLYMLGEG